MTNADKILFHPSSLGLIMTGVAKNWSVADSLTCKRKLVKIYREIKYGRYYSHSNKYTEKGKKMEEDGITLYSLYRKEMFKKNEERLENDYFTGEIDIRFKKKRETIDIKCSWSLDTFPHSLTDKADSDYEYQGRPYMDLDDADKHIIAYCLVNAPLNLITKAKESLWYNLNCPGEGDVDYLNGRIEIEKNMIFDSAQFKKDNPHYDFDCKEWAFDIPKEERVVEFVIERNEMKTQIIKDRIAACREWMNENLFKQTPELQPALYEKPNENLQDPDDDFSDMDDEDDTPDFNDPGEPDYYWCSCCNATTSRNPGGWGCPRCGAIMEEEYF